MLSAALDAKRRQLLDMVRSYGSCTVAFSGGVDSAVVAQAARLSLADSAVAVTAVSPSLAEGELEQARQLARQIGIRHLVIETGELDRPAYIRNAPDRCYTAKPKFTPSLLNEPPNLGSPQLPAAPTPMI